MRTGKLQKTVTYTMLTCGIILISIPFYLTIVSAFKDNAQLHGNFFGLPQTLYLDNFVEILSKPNYFLALRNSFFITISGLFLCGLFLPMASYAVSRRMNTSKIYKFLYFFLISGLFVPFMVRMMPVISLLNDWGLANMWGIVLIYIGGSTCEGIFLMVGYLSAIPNELEEAADIDGASTFRTFRSIMFPLMRPIVATVLIKNGLWFWNDYLLPSLVLRTPEQQTLILFQYRFQGEYATEYPLVFACLLLAMLPIMIFYLFMQKHIIGGMMQGAVKG